MSRTPPDPHDDPNLRSMLGDLAHDTELPPQTRSMIRARLGLPDDLALQTTWSNRVLVHRAFWGLFGLLVIYAFGHALFGWFPCVNKSTLETLQQVVDDLRKEKGGAPSRGELLRQGG